MSSNISTLRAELEQDTRAAAQRWVRRLRILYTIIAIYLVFSVMWFAIDMADGTEDIWFYWPMLGTGVGVAVAAISLLGVGGVLGTDWEKRQINRYLDAHRADTTDSTRPDV